MQHIIEKRRQEKQLLESEENAALANSLIRQRLQEVRQSGRQLVIDALVTSTLQEFNLYNSVYQKPKFLYSTLSITRSAMPAKKCFRSLSQIFCSIPSTARAGPGTQRRMGKSKPAAVE